MLPTLKRIQKENIPEFPSWLEQIITIVNTFFQNVYQILNHGLTLQDNVRCEIKEFEQIAPIENITISTKIIPSTGILLLSITGPIFTDPVVMRAHPDRSNVIIDNISGLTTGERYKVRILIL